MLQRLLENSPEVIALLGANPFPDKPPNYVRAPLYEYRYVSSEQKESKGVWWERRLVGLYYPAVELRQNSSNSGEAPSDIMEGIMRPREH